MKLKKLFIIAFSAFFLTLPLAAGENETMNDHLVSFAKQINNVVPDAASIQNVYSDSWIGKIYPSFPMHFALGLEGGVTQFDMKDLYEAGEMIHFTGIPSTLVFPTIGMNAKIGGLFIPFDLGFSFFTFNTADMWSKNDSLDLKFFVIGGSIRFAILQGNGNWPKWSIGASYYYSKGGIGKRENDYGIWFDYKTQTIFAETQISKTFIFVTPFIGFRAIFSSSDCEYSWKSENALDGKYTSGRGKESVALSGDFVPQIFGGLGFKLGLFSLDLNCSFDFKNELINGGASVRFQM